MSGPIRDTNEECSVCGQVAAEVAVWEAQGVCIVVCYDCVTDAEDVIVRYRPRSAGPATEQGGQTE